MANKNLIIPTITVNSEIEFDEKVDLIQKHFDRAQFDIVTKDFADNQTFDNVDHVDMIDTDLKFDLHLMTKKPLPYIDAAINSKKIDRIIFPYEIDFNYDDLIKIIKSVQKEVGISLNPETKPESIKTYLQDLDLVLTLAVEPGFYGSKYHPEVEDKISTLRSWDSQITIAVDGGIKDHNIHKLRTAGANNFCVGSFLYNGDFSEQKDKLARSLDLQ